MTEERPENQKDAGFADYHYATYAKHTTHYRQATSYKMWLELVKYLDSSMHILEIACGTGRLAHLIFDKVKPGSYVGLDFSKVAVRHARTLTPYTFIRQDIFKSDVIESDVRYDTVIACEFLEHIVNDLDFLNRLQLVPRKIRVLGSVPQSWSIDHVRRFKKKIDIYNRYSNHIHELVVHDHIGGRYIIAGWNHA